MTEGMFHPKSKNRSVDCEVLYTEASSTLNSIHNFIMKLEQNPDYAMHQASEPCLLIFGFKLEQKSFTALAILCRGPGEDWSIKRLGLHLEASGDIPPESTTGSTTGFRKPMSQQYNLFIQTF